MAASSFPPHEEETSSECSSKQGSNSGESTDGTCHSGHENDPVVSCDHGANASSPRLISTIATNHFGPPSSSTCNGPNDSNTSNTSSASTTLAVSSQNHTFSLEFETASQDSSLFGETDTNEDNSSEIISDEDTFDMNDLHENAVNLRSTRYDFRKYHRSKRERRRTDSFSHGHDNSAWLHCNRGGNTGIRKVSKNTKTCVKYYNREGNFDQLAIDDIVRRWTCDRRRVQGMHPGVKDWMDFVSRNRRMHRDQEEDREQDT